MPLVGGLLFLRDDGTGDGGDRNGVKPSVEQ